MTGITPMPITSQEDATAPTGEAPPRSSQRSRATTEPDQPRRSDSTITTRHRIIPALPLFIPAIVPSSPRKLLTNPLPKTSKLIVFPDKEYPHLPPGTHYRLEDHQPATNPDTRTVLATPRATAVVEPGAAVMTVPRNEVEAAEAADGTGGRPLIESAAVREGGEGSGGLRGELQASSPYRGTGRYRRPRNFEDSSSTSREWW
ncbi:hypothetical protein P167DRAFT_143823 [Morchella conica CCBAS932]|uniref:Uncharacterized protein n=1 Tax=Morchella conica CCBAS932 TaxID=1392247 RepID=A0A3N4K7H0_9PEZI|nr:hypothetical protein P167DRAFT_143823 [Morchella conica CCBAS932]